MPLITRLTRELYDERDKHSSDHPTTEGPIKSYLKRLGERTGIIPAYSRVRDFLKNEPVEEPMYLNHPTLLGRYVRPLARKLKTYFGDTMDFAPYFKKLRIKVAPLPTYVQPVIEVGPNYIRQRLIPRGKVFGLYRPGNDEITVDPVALPEINDEGTSRFRRWLGRYGLANDDPEGVIGHEMVHYAQKVSGAIDRYAERAGRYARAYIEGSATHHTGEMLGRDQRNYQRETGMFRKLRNYFGNRRSFLGNVPAAALAPA